MKAFILAAGFGTRLGEITKKTPKCLIDIGGVTVLERVITRLKAVGVDYVVINLHHLADQVVEFVKGKSSFGLRVEFSDETDKILGTGGGIKYARKFLDGTEPFFVHNADIISEIDLKELFDVHVKESALATLAVMNRESSRRLIFDGKNHLLGWENTKTGKSRSCGDLKNKGSSLAFSGVHVLSPEIFSYMPADSEVFDIVEMYLNAAEKGGKIIGHDVGLASWIDIGTAEALEKARSKG